MAGRTEYFASQSLSWALSADTVTRPTAWMVALFQTVPTSDDGTGGTECTASGYARFTASMTVVSSKTGSMQASASFGPISEGMVVSGVALYSHDNMLYYDAVALPISASSGSYVVIPTGSLLIKAE